MPAAVPFNQIVYFGDSLTDTNEAFRLSELALDVPFPSAPFGYDGQFSDGPVYSDIVPELLDIGVENFAVGGARALGVIPAAFLLDTGEPDIDDTLFDFFGREDLDPSVIDELANFDINLNGQIGRYLATLEGLPAEPGTAASIFIGLNDFNAFTPSGADVNMDDVVDALDVIAEFQLLAGGVLDSTLTAAGTLLGTGAAEKVFINALPPGTFFPSIQFADPLIQSIADSAVAEYNAALTFVAAETFGTAVEVIRFDAIATEIQKDPSAFGFLDITGFNLFVTGAGAVSEVDGEPQINIFENPAFADLDSDQYGFVDPIHFTSALHGVFGAFAAGQIADTLSILTGEADDQTFGGANDLILAGDENDTIRSRSGDDTVIAGLGDDTVRANAGDDIVV
ncbi:MAG: SGNH/GDSL hydrolase family protein, partial [Pseudomonadota bacterium]